MGVLQINDVDAGVLERYSVLKKKGGEITAGKVFAAGLAEFDKAAEEVETKKPLSMDVLDQLNREIADLKVERDKLAGKLSAVDDEDIEGLKVENSALTKLVEALKVDIESYKSDGGVTTADADAHKSILTQLADGGLTLKDFKEQFGEAYKTVVLE